MVSDLMMHLGYVLAPIIGFVAGFLGTLLGIGGGSVMVPLLVIAGVDIKKAVPASLFAILGTSTGGLRRLFGEGLVDYKLAVILEAASVTGASIGVYSFGKMTSNTLQALLASILLVTAVLFYVKSRKLNTASSSRDKSALKLIVAILASLIAGFLSATLGIGGGVVKVPILVLVLGIEMHKALSTSKLMVGITAATGVIGYVYTGHMDLILAILLLVGTYTGARMSTGIMVKMESRWLLVIASSYYIVTSAILFYKIL